MNRENLEQHFWYRILKVLHVLLYVLAAGIVVGVSYVAGETRVCELRPADVFSAARRVCNYEWQFDPAFWPTIGAIVAAYVAIEIIRRTTLYIIVGKKPPPGR